MKKSILFVLILTIAVVSSAQAKIKMKDMEDKHWASWAVYELVKMGVTRGFPDGTFRGTQKITRYETAIFLAKLARALGGTSLKKDIVALKKDVASLKKDGTAGLSGSVETNWQFGNLLATAGSARGAVASYRLKLSSEKKIDKDTNVKINLDTMDYGFLDDGQTTTGGKIAQELIDIESNLKTDMTAFGLANPVYLKLTVGPGAKQHAADASSVIPSLVGVVYNRPDTAIMASTKMWGADVSGGYIAKSLLSSGRLAASELQGSVGYGFTGVPWISRLRLDATAEWLSSGMFSSADRDLRGVLSLSAPLGKKVSASGTIGIAGSGSSQMMLAGQISLIDLLDSGTDATINISRVGSSYLNTSSTFNDVEFDMAGLDTFKRPLENGTVNLGGQLVQTVNKDVKLVGKGDLRLNSNYQYSGSQARLTAQGGVSYAIAPNTKLDAAYRVHQDKGTGDTSDLAALGLMYNF